MQVTRTDGTCIQEGSGFATIVEEAFSAAVKKDRGPLFESLDLVVLAEGPLKRKLGAGVGLVTSTLSFDDGERRYRVFWLKPEMRLKFSKYVQGRGFIEERNLRLARPEKAQ